MRSTAERVACLAREGYLVLDRAAPAAALRACRDAMLDELEACFRRARSLGLGTIPVGDGAGYAEIVHRSPGRFELRPAIERRALADGATWARAVRAALGAKARPVDRRVSMTEPGAETGPWETGAAVPSLAVLVPLTPGAAIEIRPGSHLSSDARVTVTPSLGLGGALLVDGRVLRRWCENPSDEHRPILCVTYAPPGFRELSGFPSRSLFADLPEARAAVQKV